jgi:hypothetical protein
MCHPDKAAAICEILTMWMTNGLVCQRYFVKGETFVSELIMLSSFLELLKNNIGSIVRLI